MSCNPDKNKQINAHDPLLFNNMSVFWIPVQKPLGLYFGEKLHFQHHFKKKNKKARYGIKAIHECNSMLPCQSLSTIHKSVFMPHLDYSNIIYN